jgi:hypothetical protein
MLTSRIQTLMPTSLPYEHVKLNVGGMRFETTRTTLQRCPLSMLAVMFSGREGVGVPLDADGYAFIDRNGTHFGTILDYLRTDELQLPVDGAAIFAALTCRASTFPSTGRARHSATPTLPALFSAGIASTAASVTGRRSIGRRLRTLRFMARWSANSFLTSSRPSRRSR